MRREQGFWNRFKAAVGLGATFAFASIGALALQRTSLLESLINAEPKWILASSALVGAAIGALFPMSTLTGMRTAWRLAVAACLAGIGGALAAWGSLAIFGTVGVGVAILTIGGAAAGAWLGWRYWRTITDSLDLPTIDL